MATGFAFDRAALAFGRRVKRLNALTAAAFGGSLALLATALFPAGVAGWLAGLLLGAVYANAFEYALHRFVLHAPESTIPHQHDVHHTSWGRPDEPLYINFTRRPWVVVLLFTVNGLPVLAVEALVGLGVAAGILAAFTLYFIVYEEIHWRIHAGGLPRWLDFSRRHHLAHHAGEEGRYNVWLPLWDSVVKELVSLGNRFKRGAPRIRHPAARASAASRPDSPYK
jgi:sterol desaturase/sphingolipid hydroxylase (fatty acid hydroxylase superfamily)